LYVAKCPACGSTRVWRDGRRKTGNGDVQRYLCRNCGFRFSESNQKNLYTPSSKSSSRQICVSPERKAKNLVEVETQQKRSVGDTKIDKATIEGKIIEYTFWMKKQGYSESTIKFRRYILQNLMRRGANILDPESVKETIAYADEWNENTKSTRVLNYASFLKFLGLTWEEPRYKRTSKIPFIPTEKEINDLVAHAGKKLSVALAIAKGTGARIGEILRLRWTDINDENKTVTFNSPEKGSNSRIINIRSTLLGMIMTLPKKYEYVFGTPNGIATSSGYSSRLASVRKRCSWKLNNPRLNQISFHTIRHWKGTREYHKTKDILHVKELLGHKNINNTLIYINLERAVFKTSNDEFTVRAVNTLEEACKLLEVGFEYVTDINDKKLFRKRK